MKLFVSTTAFRRQKIEDIIKLAVTENLNLEFSSGLAHREDMIAIFKQAACQRIPHNYFPAPKDPFVLNLASDDPNNRERSLAHARQGIELASQTGASFYSLHAGFCLDPRPEELGQKIAPHTLIPRNVAWNNFTKGVSELCQWAKQNRVDLLIENNVVSKKNLREDGSNPFLCANAEEFSRLAIEVNHPNLGLLIDTAHLKVSANTLDFDPNNFVRQCSQWVRALHHSDNDGLEDSNQPLQEDYWFLPHMKLFSEATHVLEVHDQTVSDIHRQFKLLEEGAQ